MTALLDPPETDSTDAGGVDAEERKRGLKQLARQRLSERCKRLKGCNERGNPVGEWHHNTRIPDAVVVECRRLREQEGLSYAEIATQLKLRFKTVRKLCRYERRFVAPTRWKEVDDEAKQEG